MKKLGLFLVGFSLLFLVGCNLTMIQNEQEYSLDAKELQKVIMDLDEGEVEVYGEDRTDIKVVATFASRGEEEELTEQFQIDNMSVSLEQVEDEAHLTTNIYRGDQSPIEARIHIKAYIPNELEVIMNHDGGGLRIKDLSNSLVLTQGAGKIEIGNMNGNITITDGTGAIELTDSVGDISINNNSGAVHIKNSTGDVKLISGSGQINVEEIKGLIQIRSGSGSIYVDQVDGDVNILENRSGSIEITNVTGNINQ
ncbi:DUF4097 domain-containing protein [Alkalihalobacterium elongatum]|uniref:DUF4097 domain-containing protein n=1 Tax=Alkalihalobacterium elongatum TaxID=2675466 RepID=UPI001C1FAAE1|nr:DUF4097 domain-containing protein [Alkalihalobacterium elongatum]